MKYLNIVPLKKMEKHMETWQWNNNNREDEEGVDVGEKNAE